MIDASENGMVGQNGLSIPRSGRLNFLVILYMIAVVLPIEFNVGSLSLSVLRVFLLIMFLPLLVGLYLGKFGRVIPADIFMGLHVVWISVCLMVNNPEQAAQNFGSTTIEVMGGYALARVYIRDIASFMALARLLFILITITLPFALVESQNGIPIIPKIISSIPGLKSVADVQKELRMGLERSQVTFEHPIHYGLFCSTAFSLAFVGFRGVYSGFKRYIVSGIIGLAVFLSLSSGALLAVILQVFLIGWGFLFRKTSSRWILLLLFLILIYVAIDLFSNRTPLRVFFTYATFSTHNAYWRGIIFEWGMINVWANPLFGLGLKTWVRPSYMYSGSMDNFWLVMAVRYGIPGFLLIVLGYADILFRVMLKRIDDPLTAQLRLAWIITFVGLSFTLSTVHIWTAVYSFVFFLLGSGAWIANDHHDIVRSANQAPQESLRPPVRYSRGFPPAPATRTVVQKIENGQSRGEIRFSRFPTSDT